MSNPQIRMFPDVAALADAAALHIVASARAAVAAHERFTIALSGGSTPRAVYERLAQPALSDLMPWTQTYVFWSDERAVPLDHPDSNYRMACEALLSHVPIPKDQIKQERALPTSAMPAGLIADLKDEPLRDFFAYLSMPDPRGAKVD